MREYSETLKHWPRLVHEHAAIIVSEMHGILQPSQAAQAEISLHAHHEKGWLFEAAL